jgi:hypothetical protein
MKQPSKGRTLGAAFFVYSSRANILLDPPRKVEARYCHVSDMDG